MATFQGKENCVNAQDIIIRLIIHEINRRKEHVSLFWYSNEVFVTFFFGVPTQEKKKRRKRENTKKKKLVGKKLKKYISEKRILKHLENSQRLVEEDQIYKY